MSEIWGDILKKIKVIILFCIGVALFIFFKHQDSENEKFYQERICNPHELGIMVFERRGYKGATEYVLEDIKGICECDGQGPVFHMSTNNWSCFGSISNFKYIKSLDNYQYKHWAPIVKEYKEKHDRT